MCLDAKYANLQEHRGTTVAEKGIEHTMPKRHRAKRDRSSSAGRTTGAASAVKAHPSPPPSGTALPSTQSGRGTANVPRRSAVPLIAAIVVVIVIALAGVGYTVLRPVGNAILRPAPSADALGTPIPDEGRQHVAEGQAIVYRTNPPASGPHYPSPQPWGVYTEPVATGYWVHNLEHGGIVVLYDCPTGCPDIVDQLRQAFATFPKDRYDEVKLLATPYTGLPNGVRLMAVAWDYQQVYSSFDRERLLAFYNAHVDRGPEDVP